MPNTRNVTCARERLLVLRIVCTALAVAAAVSTVACESNGPENGSAPITEGPPQPEVLSLAPSETAVADLHEFVLSWKPISGIDRFVLCQTVPPQGTDCAELRGVSETTVAIAGPADDPQATGTWLKYLWLQSCGERECSRPPTAAGVIAHRVVFGTNAWNFVVVVRRLERNQVEVVLANASQGQPGASTLILRTPEGSEIARCENIASGEWCGPLQRDLLSNEVVAEQIYGDLDASVEFSLMPSTTAQELNQQPAP